MNPKVWGSDVWKAMHLIAAGYPNKPTPANKKHYKRLYKALGCTLPCGMCAKSYRAFMKQLKIDNFLCSKKRLMYWVFLMHNRVNKKLNKKPRKSFRVVCNKYMSMLKK